MCVLFFFFFLQFYERGCIECNSLIICAQNTTKISQNIAGYIEKWEAKPNLNTYSIIP